MNNTNTCFDLDFIINSLGRGGAERVCITLANEMVKRGLKIRIITLRNVKNNYNSDVDKRVKIKCLNAKKDLFGLLILKKELKNLQIKKIIAFDERITSVCNYVKIKHHKKYIIISRVINNVDFQEKENKRIIYKFMYKFSKKYFKYADKYIFQCKSMKNRMKNYFNLDDKKSKLVYIYNPLSDSFYDVKITEKKENYFLMVGRLESQKGYEYVIEALKKCKDYGKNIHVKILGDGSLKSKLEKEIEVNNLNIELLGNVNNPKDYYIKAKALILTSKYEGFPNVLLEANACGCPIISFDCPTGPSEIINDYNGILIKYLSTDDLTNEIINFDNIKWDYKKIAESVKKYDKNIIIKKYIDVITGDKNE